MLLEENRDAQRRCKKIRPFGVAVAMMAVLGLLGFASWTQQPRSMKQHLAVVRKGLLKAFSPRALEDVAKLHTSIALSLHQDGRVPAAKMSMRATISKDEHPAPHPQLVIDVGAEKGKVEKLEKTLKKLLKTLPPPGAGHHGPPMGHPMTDYPTGHPYDPTGYPMTDSPTGQPYDPTGYPMTDSPTLHPYDPTGSPTRQLYPSPTDYPMTDSPTGYPMTDSPTGYPMTDSPTGDGFRVVGNKDDDIVQIMVDIPMEGELEDEMEQSLNTEPTLSASVEFGRTLDEMCHHMDENIPMVFDGLKLHMDASFAATMAKVARTMDEEYGAPAFGKEVAWLQALSEIRANIEFAYDDPETLSDDLKNTFPPLGGIVGMLAQVIHSTPPDFQKAVKKLDGLSSGTRRIALEGLPHGFKLVLELHHFNLAPVLSLLIGDLEDLD